MDRVQAELRSLGYQTELRDSPHGKTVVFFPYEVEVGTHAGKTVMLAIGMQGSELYPEYPPHWLHVHPPTNDGKGGVVTEYKDDLGRDWIAMSRPPGPLWDELPTKSMRAFLDEHVRRFWNSM